MAFSPSPVGLRGGPGEGPVEVLVHVPVFLWLSAASSSSGENTSMSSRGVQRGSCWREDGEGSRVTEGAERGFMCSTPPTPRPCSPPSPVPLPCSPPVSSLICQTSLHHFWPKTLSRIGTQSWETERTGGRSGSGKRKKEKVDEGAKEG